MAPQCFTGRYTFCHLEKNSRNAKAAPCPKRPGFVFHKHAMTAKVSSILTVCRAAQVSLVELAIVFSRTDGAYIVHCSCFQMACTNVLSECASFLHSPGPLGHWLDAQA